MTNNEKLFRLLGWFKTIEGYWFIPHYHEGKRVSGTSVGKHLPDAENVFEACRKYVIPAMRENGWYPSMVNITFCWMKQLDFDADLSEPIPEYHNVIMKDENLPKALVEATIEVLEKEA